MEDLGELSRAVRGRAWVFGDNVDGAEIMPGKYNRLPDEELAAHILEGRDPEFPKKFRPGDVIVGGKNFGCGSTRETAPRGLKMAKVGAIVARSFARGFYRNALCLGLFSLPCPGAGGIREGDELKILPLEGVIENLTRGESYRAERMPPHILEMVRAGGLIPHLKRRFGKG